MARKFLAILSSHNYLKIHFLFIKNLVYNLEILNFQGRMYE